MHKVFIYGRTLLLVGIVLLLAVVQVHDVRAQGASNGGNTTTTDTTGDGAADGSAVDCGTNPDAATCTGDTSGNEKVDAPLPPGKVDPSKIGYNGFVTSSTTAFEHLLNLIYTWSAIVAVIILVVAGYLFVTARGDPSQMKRSKDAIRGAVVGLVIVAIAFVITRVVIGGVQG